MNVVAVASLAAAEATFVLVYYLFASSAAAAEAPFVHNSAFASAAAAAAAGAPPVLAAAFAFAAAVESASAAVVPPLLQHNLKRSFSAVGLLSFPVDQFVVKYFVAYTIEVVAELVAGHSLWQIGSVAAAALLVAAVSKNDALPRVSYTCTQ